MSNESLRQFERCPRCGKMWNMFAVYRCPSCSLTFCAGCDLDDPGSHDLRWIAAAAAELTVSRCPACTAAVTDADKIGVLVGRDKMQREREQQDLVTTPRKYSEKYIDKLLRDGDLVALSGAICSSSQFKTK